MSTAEDPTTGPPPNWRVGRQRHLVAFLQVMLGVLGAAAGAAVLLPDGAGHRAAVVMVALLIAVPTVRVAWLLVRWARIRDWRFVAAAAGLLGILGVAAALAG